jgi:hypothetical protein
MPLPRRGLHNRRPIDGLVRIQLRKTAWNADAREKNLAHLGGLFAAAWRRRTLTRPGLTDIDRCPVQNLVTARLPNLHRMSPTDFRNNMNPVIL